VYAAYRARLQIGQGDRPAVERWVQQAGLRVDDALDFFHEFEHLTLCRALLALGQPGEALLLLERLLPIVEAEGRADRAIDVHLLQALAHHSRGDLPAALAALERALGLAEPEGYARVFLDEGARMEGLLAQAERHHLHPHYVRGLRRSFALPPGARPDGSPLGHVTDAPPVDAPLLEPLTEREREVLGLIAAGASNRAIADRLVVSLGTVKKHGNNIYGKLGVQSRTQAIARGRALGLL
jgi:LuxR family maltose regulon positive regulatory protein